MANPQATARIQPKKQTLDDAYAPPANFLEIDLVNPETHGIGNKRYTDYELRMRVSDQKTYKDVRGRSALNIAQKINTLIKLKYNCLFDFVITFFIIIALKVKVKKVNVSVYL